MDSSAYLSQLLALLPPGDALAREPGSALERLLTVPAAELARVDGRVEALLAESDPARTAEMLADWERALGLPDECYPNESFSRASRAWYFDGAGVLREAAVDEPRYLFDANGQRTEAVLLEGAATNFLFNPRAESAVAGTPGALPTQWGGLFGAAENGLGREIIGSFTVQNIPVARIRIHGTTTGAAFGRLTFWNALTQLPPVVLGEAVTSSVYMRLVSGTFANLTWRTQTYGLNALGVFVGAGGIVTANFVPTAAPLSQQRVIATFTTTNASIAFVAAALDYVYSSGVTVDFTVDIALPQIEKGFMATSPVMNPVGAPAATTRAADNRFIATIEERRARVLARLIERFEPTPIAIIGLAARLGDTVTLTEFRPHDCEDDADQPLLDDAWAHAFKVAGASSLVVEFTCLDGCETPLSQWRTGAYECAIRRFAPAHTVPIFSYA